MKPRAARRLLVKAVPATAVQQLHSKSSTQVTLQEVDARPIESFAHQIPDAEIYTEGMDYGRELLPHVTILYGITNDDPEPVRRVCEGTGPIVLILGLLSAFENPDKPYDVLKVSVDSADLHRLNAAIKAATENSSDFPSYTPHLTIAYLKKGEAAKYVGGSQFAGKSLTFSSFEFRARDGKSTEIQVAAVDVKK